MKHLDNIPYFFILGRGRSGTTLLATILDAHPNTVVPLECPYILNLRTKYEHVQWDQSTVQAFYSDLWLDPKFKLLWKYDKEKLLADLLGCENIDFKKACKIVALNHIGPFKHDEIQLIGDKNPFYSLLATDLLELFPDSKFIHMVRDYRDNICSHTEKTTTITKNAGGLAWRWKKFNQEIEKAKALKPDQFHFIKYEDLVEDPEKEVRAICEFLGIAYHERMLNYHESTEHYDEKFGKLMDIHGRLKTRIDATGLGRWQQELTEKQVRTAENICRKLGKKYDYPRVFQTNKRVMSIGILISKWSLEWLKWLYHRSLGVRTFCLDLMAVLVKPTWRKKLDGEA